jgi:hypothetical protein
LWPKRANVGGGRNALTKVGAFSSYCRCGDSALGAFVYRWARHGYQENRNVTKKQ